MKLKELVAAYKLLGEVKATTLEQGEVIKIVKARKAMRPFAEEYDAFLRDCQEKFKPENFGEIQQRAQKWDALSDEEKKELNKQVAVYNGNINKAVIGELEKEVDVTVEKLNDDTLTKMLQENGWELKKLDELGVMI